MKFWLLLVLFRFLLEISYIYVINPVFKYEGYLVNFDTLHYILSWIVSLLGFLFVRSTVKKVSDVFFILGYLSVLTPVSVLYGYDSSKSFFPLGTIFLVFYIIACSLKVKYIVFPKLPVVKRGVNLAVFISILFVIFLLVWYGLKGVSYNLNFQRVYEYRSANSELADIGLLSYTNNWTTKIFNIFLISMSLLYRRYFLMIILLLIQVYFFAASAHKSVLFLPFLVMGIWFYFRKSNNLKIIPRIFIIIATLPLISYFVFGDLLISSMMIRRVFFVPAYLNFVYFEFFENSPNIFWSNSVLSPFIDYPYDIPLVNVIGRSLGKPDMAANNGFVASGFAHAGIVGVLTYSFIIAGILRIVDQISDRLPLWFALSLTIVPLRSLLVGSDLLTVLLTHGFIVALGIVFLVRRAYSN